MKKKNYYKDLEKYDDEIYCNTCGSVDVYYQRSVANGEVWECKLCGQEVLTSHKPNEDDYRS